MPSRPLFPMPQDHVGRLRSTHRGGATGRAPRETLHLPQRREPVTQLDPDEVKPSVLRLKRASGQLNAVIRMLEAGRDCEEVITQIAAVSKAIDRAGYSIIAHGMRTCLLNDPTGESINAQKLEKLFLSLS